MIKKVILSLLPDSIKKVLRNRAVQKEMQNWKDTGCPSPPPHIVKQMAIQEYQQKYNCSVLVETGTFLGDMVEAQKGNFKKVFSIELGEKLYEDAVNRFKNDSHVKIVQGDSGKVLASIMREVNDSAVFWLDGHYSAGITAKGDKECPIFEELNAIFASKKLAHVLLIDDARCFTGEGDYPTIENLTTYIQNQDPRYQVEVKHDIIRYTI